MKGNVKAFFDEKRFGFIVGEDGKEYFVHQTEIKDGSTLKEGDEVTFDGEEGEKGPKAVNVSKAGEASEDSSDESSDDSGDESSDESEEKEAA
ncbi:hypothetical protein CMO91_00210 [Candidatus Woesearchaeota archaeon]|nr:hypothetical protein [Candidatus Woesearchaeota archaeon]|tara:strand:- start:896 stop:1174 length:279 start_codon:yes stop_codon:yes gene_type:complete